VIKTTITVPAVEISREEREDMLARWIKYGVLPPDVLDWNIDANPETMRFVGDFCQRVVVESKIKK